MDTISINANVTDENGETFSVVTNSYDVFKSEQALGSLKSLKGEISATEMFYLIYFAAKRAGRAGDDFEAWLQTVSLDIEPDEVADPKD